MEAKLVCSQLELLLFNGRTLVCLRKIHAIYTLMQIYDNNAVFRLSCILKCCHHRKTADFIRSLGCQTTKSHITVIIGQEEG